MPLATVTTAVGALAFVVALAMLAQFLARHFKLAQRLTTATRGTGRLAIEQSLALDPRRRLLLIRCDNRQLLLLTGGSQDQMLGWLEPTDGQEVLDTQEVGA